MFVNPADINYCGTKTFYGNKYFCSSIIQKNIIGTLNFTQRRVVKLVLTF